MGYESIPNVTRNVEYRLVGDPVELNHSQKVKMANTLMLHRSQSPMDPPMVPAYERTRTRYYSSEGQLI
eukprot:681809-Amphidinium_carterae.2